MAGGVAVVLMRVNDRVLIRLGSQSGRRRQGHAMGSVQAAGMQITVRTCILETSCV